MLGEQTHPGPPLPGPCSPGRFDDPLLCHYTPCLALHALRGYAGSQVAVTLMKEISWWASKNWRKAMPMDDGVRKLKSVGFGQYCLRARC